MGRKRAAYSVLTIGFATMGLSGIGHSQNQQECNVIGPSRFGQEMVVSSNGMRAFAEQGRTAELIVRLRKGARINLRREVEKYFGPGRVIFSERPSPIPSSNIRIVRITRMVKMQSAQWKAQLDDMLAKLNGHPDIEYCQKNSRMTAFTTRPTDPCYGLQWHYWPQGRGAEQSAGGIDFPAAWDLTRGSRDVVIAVVDSGQYFAHSDINRANLIQGHDFVDRDSDPTDPGPSFARPGQGFHGTHVSGTIGTLAADNRQGGLSGMWEAAIQPVRVLDGNGSGSDLSVALGIMWAAGVPLDGVPVNRRPAKIINLSLGSEKSCTRPESGLIIDAIEAAQARGVLIVAAAGNSNSDTINFSPASCPGVLAVGAMDLRGRKAGYSNWGKRVDISAPGGDTRADINRDGFPDGVLSSYPGGFLFQPGTSMAAPHVSAVAGLIYAVRPEARPADVINWIKSTATPSGCSQPCGAGLINAGRAVKAAVASLTSGVGSGGRDAGAGLAAAGQGGEDQSGFDQSRSPSVTGAAPSRPRSSYRSRASHRSSKYHEHKKKKWDPFGIW